MLSGRATIIQGDARNLPLPDNSVDLIVTSPPYFALRSYQDNGEHYAGQVGSEATPQEFLEALWDCTREWVRVLKPAGSLWVNLGDKYSGGSSGESNLAKLGERLGTGGGHSDAKAKVASKAVAGVRPKTLIGLPWRYALGCIDQLGLILRAEVIWSKPNGLPESVTDRVRRSHEQWFHFTMQPRYFSAVDEIRGRTPPGTASRYVAGFGSNTRAHTGNHNNGALRGMGAGDGGPTTTNPLGKLPGSVWTIPTEPLQVPDHLGVDHFAAFPSEWPRRIIAGWSPAGVCEACGEGRRPVTQVDLVDVWHNKPLANTRYCGTENQHQHNRMGKEKAFGRSAATITGYACACPTPDAPTRPAVILDPFGGTGTTALAAKVLGRHGISVDLSGDYCRLARWRTNDPDQIAHAARVDKPDPIIDGQVDLLDLIDGGAA